MKFIHCSDLHLDSSMETNLPPEKARQRANEICATFRRMAAYAAERQVTAVLIAGDLFDTARVTGKTADYILSVIAQTPSVDFLYLCGNHDESRRAFAGRELPENLKTFGSEWRYYRYGAVCIAGIEPEEQTDWYSALRLDERETNLVLLHGQEATQRGPGLVCLPQLRDRGIDYLALGHLHSYREQKLDLRGRWCYCGCLEGRGFDECGQKGFVLVEAEDGKVKTEFVPFAKRTLHEIPVDISQLQTVSQIGQAMRSAAEGVAREDLVKFTLRGAFTTDTQKDLRFLTQTMEPDYYFVKIKDETTLRLEKQSYEHDISLKGEFIRMVMASDQSEQDRQTMILWGLQALSGEEIVL